MSNLNDDDQNNKKTFLWFFEGPITGKKSGNEGLNPNHSSSCSGKSPSIYLALLIKFLTLDFDNGLSKPPNSTVPTTLKPCSIGVIPNPLFENITGLFKRRSQFLK